MLLQEVISFFGEHFFTFSVVSAVIVIAVIAGMGLMFSQLRGQVKKLKKENSRFTYSVDFLMRAKGFGNFSVLKGEYEKLKKIGAIFPEGDFWGEQLHNVSDRLIIIQMNGLCKFLEEGLPSFNENEILTWLQKGEEIIWDGEYFASHGSRIALKRNFEPIFSMALTRISGLESASSLHKALKIRDRIFPELVSSHGDSGGHIIYG